jgi:hypothetical protein
VSPYWIPLWGDEGSISPVTVSIDNNTREREDGYGREEDGVGT